ncbi:cytochrome c4 precursor [Variibacter gotjawalensis]|uniref:Cytochrome c4 n=1 Tax=Variibacter gotjawalensis TaxID=1333996 RepID=A0A0S3PPT4_9BRAD|nr:c-type cytochrome [Variibacter gotjawalensis]NIK48071.1 cytochrome c553 [Variibacter gotjawalensis]RZS49947.1 cytochrome c553 [Variibacter gotjawalensis]BAT57774.1 cytochrome c4 precursor [Variibacter gotjawalensis]
MRRLIATALACFAMATLATAQTFEERTQLCLGCHGEKGQSETAEVPSLGGLTSAYALIQLYMFREKLRTAEPMNDMMQGVSDGELQKLADLIAKMPPPKASAEPIDPERAARAQGLIAAHRCAFCHNTGFPGTDSVPRLGGQREDYLVKTLTEYRSGKRNEYQPVMAEIIRKLSDQDIADLAHVIARTGAK